MQQIIEVIQPSIGGSRSLETLGIINDYLEKGWKVVMMSNPCYDDFLKSMKFYVVLEGDTRVETQRW